MRKIFFTFFAMTFVLLGGVAAGSALAKPVDPDPVRFTVAGTFSSEQGVPGVPLQATVTVTRFAERDGQLVVEGTLAGADEGLFTPLAITAVATVAAVEDPASGCTVRVDTANTVVNSGFIISLNGASFTLSAATEPGAARELCRVVQTAAKDSADQNALAKALNKVLRGA